MSFSLVPSADVGTKQPLLLASGDYPDVIWDGSFTQTDALKYGTDHVLIPLNGLIKKYAPNVEHVIKTSPGYKQAVTAPNGKIYVLAAYDTCYHCYWTYQYFINVADLQKYGLTAPTTTSQFTHVLEVFKQHGLVPLTGASLSGGGYANDIVTFLMNSFLPYDGPSTANPYLAVSNGKVVFDPTQARWEAGLKYIHSLYTKGLFSKTALTQQSTQIEQLVTDNKVGVVPTGDIDSVIANYGKPGAPTNDWFALPPLTGPSGARYDAFNQAVAQPSFALTSKSTLEQRIRIMKLLNFMFSLKGQEEWAFGVKGGLWFGAKKGQQGLVPGQAKFNSNWNMTVTGGAVQNDGWNDWGPYISEPGFYNYNYTAPAFSSNGSQARVMLGTEVSMAGHQSPEQYPNGVWVSPSKAQTFGTEQTNIDNYVAQWTDWFITGERPIAADWSSYVNGLNSLSLHSYVQLAQRYMGKPFNSHIKFFTPSAAEIKYLVGAGPVPSSVKRFLTEVGVPAADFSKG